VAVRGVVDAERRTGTVRVALAGRESAGARCYHGVVMSVRKQLAYLAAGITLALGLLGLLNPLLTVRLYGLEVVDPRGLSEVRAVFGALFIVMGGVMLWAVSTRSAAPAYLRLPGILIASAALGRFLSIVIDGVLSPFNFGFLALELFVGLAALMASFEIGSRRGRGGTLATGASPDEDASDPLRAYRG